MGVLDVNEEDKKETTNKTKCEKNIITQIIDEK